MAKRRHYRIQLKEKFESLVEAEKMLKHKAFGEQLYEVTYHPFEQSDLESIQAKNNRTIKAIIFVLVILIFVEQMVFFFIYLSLLNYKP